MLNMKPKFIVLIDPLAPKVTIRKNGNLWFNLACNPLVNFELNNRYIFAEDEENKDVFYMVPTTETENSLKPVKNGKYHSIGSSVLLKKLGVMEGWHYLLKKDLFEDKPIFVFSRTEKEAEAKPEGSEETVPAGAEEEAVVEGTKTIPYREEWKVSQE